MTIANGNINPIDPGDINALTTTQQGNTQADNAQLPLGLPLSLQFGSAVAGGMAVVPARRSKTVFVAPYDLYLETVAVTSGDHTNPSTVTVDITGDGGVVNWPTRVSGSVAASPANMSRLLYDNTRTKADVDFRSTARAFRVFPKGTTVTVQASSTSATTNSLLQVELMFRQFFARE